MENSIGLQRVRRNMLLTVLDNDTQFQKLVLRKTVQELVSEVASDLWFHAIL